MPHREQIATITTKTAGVATSATGSLHFIGHYQNEIIAVCTIIGAVITVISYFTMRHYQKQRATFEKNRDLREQELHELKLKAFKNEG